MEPGLATGGRLRACLQISLPEQHHLAPTLCLGTQGLEAPPPSAATGRGAAGYDHSRRQSLRAVRDEAEPRHGVVDGFGECSPANISRDRLLMVAWLTIRRFGLWPWKSRLPLEALRSLAMQASIGSGWRADDRGHDKPPDFRPQGSTLPCRKLHQPGTTDDDDGNSPLAVPVRTANLDGLGRRGVRFTAALGPAPVRRRITHSPPACCPPRGRPRVREWAGRGILKASASEPDVAACGLLWPRSAGLAPG